MPTGGCLSGIPTRISGFNSRPVHFRSFLERKLSIKQQRSLRFNRQITAYQVRVTRQEDNAQLGIMSLQDALDLAYREGLDLVEVVPSAKPPVCSIMDMGKYRFDQKKKEREQRSKQKAVAAKEIRLRPVSNDSDVDHKIEQLKKFLAEKRTVSVNVRFKNRELLANRDGGHRIIDKIVKAVENVAKAEQPRFEGTTLSVRFMPK